MPAAALKGCWRRNNMGSMLSVKLYAASCCSRDGSCCQVMLPRDAAR